MTKKNTNFEKIADKIQKCLTLANNDGATDGEKQAAALMAQKLMAEYNLTADNLPGEKKREVILVTCEYKQKRRQPYQAELGGIIAKNFRCRGITTPNADGNRDIQFLGFTEDANAAKAVFEYLYHEIYRGVDKVARELAKNNQPRNGECRSYTHGFLAGLRTKFDEQCKALMVVTPKEVDEHAATMNLKRGKLRQGGVTNEAAYTKGFTDAKSAMSARELKGAN